MAWRESCNWSRLWRRKISCSFWPRSISASNLTILGCFGRRYRLSFARWILRSSTSLKAVWRSEGAPEGEAEPSADSPSAQAELVLVVAEAARSRSEEHTAE